MKIYKELPPLECLAGDTIGPMNVAVQNDGEAVNVSGLSMRLIVAKKHNPSIAVFAKECTNTDSGFSVALTSADTAGWNGAYLIHFALCDAEGLVYRKLAGTLHVYPVPKGGIT